MVVSLLGILGLQAYWLKQAIDRSTAEFDQRANRALRASAMKLARLDIEDHLENQIDGLLESMTWPDSLNLDSVSQSFKETQSEIIVEEKVGGVSEAKSKRPRGREKFIVIESVTSDDGTEEIEIIRKQGLEVIEKAVHSVIIREFKEEVSLGELLGKRDVGEVIQEQLQAEGLDLDFEYMVFKDSVLAKHSSTTRIELTPYKTSLFPDEDLEAFLYLGFTSKGAYVLKNTGQVLLLVALFSLLMIGTTIYAIRFMLRQKRLADMKTDFINNMTHEFKTPLATIGLAADSLRHPNLTGKKEEISRYSSIISKESKRLNTHVESLLQLAKMERGELQLDKKEVNLNDLLADVLEDNKLLFEQSEAKVSTEFPEKPCRILVDAYHLKNALTNVLDNAVKYSPEAPEISVKLELEVVQAVISIKDKGRGITDEAKKRAFESFYREQSGNLHEVKGFGVGLSYVKKIVEAHGGVIELHSKPGRGTMVILKLPCR